MPMYQIDREAVSVDGTQTFKVEADTKEEALQLFKDGDDIFVEEALEVQQLSEPELSDIYEL